MTVFQVLTEMVCTEELLALVALPKLVHSDEVVAAFGPIRSWKVREILPTISTNVRGCWDTGLLWWSVVDIGVWGNRIARMKCGLVVAVECSA